MRMHGISYIKEWHNKLPVACICCQMLLLCKRHLNKDVTKEITANSDYLSPTQNNLL